VKALRLTLFAAASALIAGTAHAQTISIGTSPVGTLNNSLGNALGKVMTEAAGIRARVVPFGGGQQVLPLINRKELEMAITAATDALLAYQGKVAFEGNPSPNLRTIGAVFPFYLGWYVKKDAPYKSLVDLKGKKIAVGFTANSAQRRVALAGFAAFGVKESDFDGVPVPHVVRGADDFMQGKVEASTFAVGAGKMAEVNAKVGGIRFLQVPNSPEALARVNEIMPTAYFSVLKPAPRFAGILEPTSLIFEDYVIMAGTQMSDDNAYKLAKLLYESQDKLAAVGKAFGLYDKTKLASNRGVPFHPGAIKYYKEKGIWQGK
jgi:TRAP transporter TAXI family solute receptor